MKILRSLVSLAFIGPLLACGSGVDAGYTCEQLRACALSQGNTPELSQNACVENIETLYNASTDAEKEEADELFKTCKDQKACAFQACLGAD